MSLEKKVGRLSGRNWVNIREAWTPYLPEIRPRGSPPTLELSRFPGIEDVFNETPDASELRREVDGLPEAIFSEGIFLLHKAANVLGAAQVHVTTGVLSWSLSSGYHSTFFSMKSILRFLGVATLDVVGKTLIVDIWPGSKKSNRNRPAPEQYSGRTLQFIKAKTRLQHKDQWTIFQRLLRVSNIFVWDQEIVRSLSNLPTLDFAHQRNALHYRNNHWPYDDLFDFLIDPDFATRETNQITHEDIDPASYDFSLILSFVMFNFAYSLFKEIVEATGSATSELGLINRNLLRDCHQLYQRAYPIQTSA